MKRDIHTIYGGLTHKELTVFPDHCHNGVMGKIIIQASKGYITTIEGILTSIKEKLSIMGDDENINVLRQRIEGIISGAEESVTIILDDDSGQSRINSSRVEIIKKK